MEIIKTSSGNHYLFDTNKKHTLFLPDRLKKVVENKISILDKNNTKIQSIFGDDSQKSKLYYQNKLTYLSNNGYFRKKKYVKKFVTQISAAAVKDSLINTDQLTFELTDKCNLNCVYCGYGKFYEGYDPRLNKDLDFNMAKKLIDYMCELWNSQKHIKRRVNIGFYGGEPLMNIKLIKLIINYIKSLDCKNVLFDFSMTTNGVLIDQHIELIVKEKIRVLISLDGDEIHNSFRIFKNGNSSFERIYSNILNIQSNYPSFFREYVDFNSVLNSRSTVEDVFTFFLKNFNKVPSIVEINHVGVKKEMRTEFRNIHNSYQYDMPRSNNMELKLHTASPKFRSFLNFIRTYSSTTILAYNDFIHEYTDRRYYPSGACLPFNKKVFLTVNGKLLTCERIDQSFVLGRISQSGVELNFKKIAKKYNAYYSEIEKQCKKCFGNENCEQCMFAFPNDTETSSFKCPYFMSKEGFTRYITDNLTYYENNPQIFSKVINEIFIG